jgi:hypothetical protein
VYDFEVFHRDAAAHSAEPLVTIQRRGNISLNTAAFEALGAPDAVELLYDPHKKVIGLRAADAKLPHAHLVRPATRRPLRGPFLISATAFVAYYNIDTSIGRRWIGFLSSDVLCIDTMTDGIPVRSNRAAAQSRLEADSTP